jgi:hypothetical protein
MADFTEGKRDKLVELEARRAALLKKTEPLRQEQEEIRLKMAPLEAKLRDVTQKIHAIERPELVDIDNERAALHRALGARSLAAS